MAGQYGTTFGNSGLTSTGVHAIPSGEQDAWNAYTTPSTIPYAPSPGELGPYAVSLTSVNSGSRRLIVDTSFEPYRREAFRHRTIAAQRESVMMTNIAGQGTVSNAGLWRREQTDWTEGAGQQYLDRKADSQENRFLSSKGVDVFSFPLQATLLPDTYRKDGLGSAVTASSNLLMSRCGDYVVYANAGSVHYVTATRAWGAPTDCTFNTTGGLTAPSHIYSITTNDTYAYIATDTGIWFCQVGASSVFTLYMANDILGRGYSLVRWANDQLIAANGPNLYSIQPRQNPATGTYPFWGNPPSVANDTFVINTIQGNGTTATVTTQTNHNYVVGQPISINGTVTVSPITLINSNAAYFKANLVNGSSNITVVGSTIGIVVGGALGAVSGIPSSAVVNSISGQVVTMSLAATATTTQLVVCPNPGVATAVCNRPHNLSAGEVIVVTGNALAGLNVPNSNQPGQTTVATVIDANTFTYNTDVTTTGTYSGGTVYGSGQYGFNTTYQVTSVPSSTTFTVASTINGNANGNGTNYAGETQGTVTASNLPDLLYTNQNPQWVWSDAAAGMTQVYFGGYVQSPSGKKYSGGVYRSDLLGSSTSSSSGIETITTSSVTIPFQLNTPVQSLPMSPDEYPVCVKSYLNFIFVGTNRGIRMTQTLSVYDPTATATGDLKSGPLIPNILQPVTLPVTAIVGDGRYVWFAWNNYDSSSTGLGKLDLSTYIKGDPLAPAYASDLMVTGQGVINSLDWDPFDNVPLMAINGLGIYAPYASNEGGNASVYQYVPNGTINSGIFSYGIPDKKIPVFFDYGAIAPASSGTSVSAFVDIDPKDEDAAGEQPIPSYPQNGNTDLSEFPVPSYQAEQFAVSVQLSSNYNNTQTPILHRWTLKAWPAAVSGTEISVVAQLFSVAVVDGMETYVDPYDTYSWLEARRRSQEILTYQEGPLTVQCVVDSLDWLPHKRRDNYQNGFEGDIVIYLKTLNEYSYTPVTTII